MVMTGKEKYDGRWEKGCSWRLNHSNKVTVIQRCQRKRLLWFLGQAPAKTQGRGSGVAVIIQDIWETFRGLAPQITGCKMLLLVGHQEEAALPVFIKLYGSGCGIGSGS